MRDHKSGRLQNSPRDTQWLSLCSTASFSWKQIILTPSIVLEKKKVLLAVGTEFFIENLHLTAQHSEGRGQVGGVVPASRVTSGPLMPFKPLVDDWWAACSLLYVASCALRYGLNCVQELIVPAPQLWTIWSLIWLVWFFRLIFFCVKRGWGPHWGGG